MSEAVLLNNVSHKDLRIITKRGAEYGDDLIIANTFPAEFIHVQAHYPIVFRKTNDGLTYDAFVLFGFVQGENLFLGPDGWDANYVPLVVQRQPFLIGVSGEELTVHIAMDSPRIGKNNDGSAEEGEAVFLTHGSPSPFMERMTSTLLAIHQGVQSMPPFIAALLAHDLLESFVYDIELDDRSKYRLDGFYTINEKKLNALNGAALEVLHRSGYLHAIYMVIASMGNFRRLIERKNRRITQPAAKPAIKAATKAAATKAAATKTATKPNSKAATKADAKLA